MNDPETAPDPAQPFRDEAACRLRDAAECDDPARRDGLMREALALLSRARVLRAWAEDLARAAEDHGDGVRPSGRTH